MKKVLPYQYEPKRIDEDKKREIKKAERIRKSAMIKPKLFDGHVQGPLSKCNCENCDSEDKSQFKYCCRDLWIHDDVISENGSKFRDNITRLFLNGQGPTGCITGNEKFKNYFLNDGVSK